tara:strand:+ start:424 stop:1380 length:957 start_codon:yes stop_codon:yes gene_type:complete
MDTARAHSRNGTDKMTTSTSGLRLGIIWLSLSVLFASVPATQAALIAYDLYSLPPNHSHPLSSKSYRLLNYENPLSHSLSSVIDDNFGVLQQGLQPLSNQLLDQSRTSNDELGIIIEDEDFSPFFAIQDLQNTHNPNGTGQAKWLFDISGTDSLEIQLDIAAMGDFEISDWFRWSYQIDDNPLYPLFKIETDTTQEHSYQLASGANVTLNDPLFLNGAPLHNDFTRFTAPLISSGNQLKLTLDAQQNGGNEVLAFRNIGVTGQFTPSVAATAIPLPTSATLLISGLVIDGFHLRKKPQLLEQSVNSSQMEEPQIKNSQ